MYSFLIVGVVRYRILLERTIEASPNPGDVVLSPFCGCGTPVIAAEKLARRRIGIDITHLSITLLRNRLRGPGPKLEPKKDCNVMGQPKGIDGIINFIEGHGKLPRVIIQVKHR